MVKICIFVQNVLLFYIVFKNVYTLFQIKKIIKVSFFLNDRLLLFNNFGSSFFEKL